MQSAICIRVNRRRRSCAKPTTRTVAERIVQLLHRARPEPGPVQQVQGSCARFRRASSPNCPLHSKKSSTTKSAISGCPVRGIVGRTKKARFATLIQEELSALSTKFSENVLDATNAFAALHRRAKPNWPAVPEDVKQAAREAAEKDGDVAKRAGWKLTLQAPCILLAAAAILPTTAPLRERTVPRPRRPAPREFGKAGK
jgi:hypothetical protein